MTDGYCKTHDRYEPCRPCLREHGESEVWVGFEDAPSGEPAVDVVKQPAHYTAGGIETIDFIAAKLGGEELAGYLRGNVLKYLSRAGLKDDAVQDFKKAQVYLGWLINHLETGSIK